VSDQARRAGPNSSWGSRWFVRNKRSRSREASANAVN